MFYFDKGPYKPNAYNFIMYKSSLLIALSVCPSVEVLKVKVLYVRQGPETQIGTRLSVYLSFTSVSAQQLPSSMLPQIHRHYSSFRKSPSSCKCSISPVCPSICRSRSFSHSNCRRQCYLKSTAITVRSGNLQAPVDASTAS
jgi:hypothetical protein